MTDVATGPGSTPAPSQSPSYRLIDGVAVVTLDDGKANAINGALLEGLHRPSIRPKRRHERS